MDAVNTNTERQRRLRQRRKEAGLVDYRRAVTQEQAKALDELLSKLNGSKQPTQPQGCGYTKHINNRSRTMKQTYEELERERNELAAQVERLSGALDVLIWQAEQVDSWKQFPSRWIDDAQSVANEQPSTALAALKAQWQAEAVRDFEAMLSSFPVTSENWIEQRAQEPSNANTDNHAT